MPLGGTESVKPGASARLLAAGKVCQKAAGGLATSHDRCDAHAAVAAIGLHSATKWPKRCTEDGRPPAAQIREVILWLSHRIFRTPCRKSSARVGKKRSSRPLFGKKLWRRRQKPRFRALLERGSARVRDRKTSSANNIVHSFAPGENSLHHAYATTQNRIAGRCSPGGENANDERAAGTNATKATCLSTARANEK